ncbi:MAG: protein kinase [Polyangiaceae bacterium]
MSSPDPFGWVGAVIDDQFAVQGVAGEGAFGVVYRGTHLGLDMPVGIKCLKVPPGLPTGERAALLDTFRGEARLLHQLSRRSAGIVQALAVGSAVSPKGAWTPYIVMEWLDGETLESDLRRRAASGVGQRTLDEALDLLGTAASALAVAHEENVSHRDVKPGNLFLTPSRRGPVLKLVDFGIAKVMDAGAPRTWESASTGGERRFTARYAAPEQLMSEYGATGPWTDVYAMALILIEVVTGRFALQGDTFVQIFASSIDTRSRPSLTARGAPAPASIEAVLSRALAIHPRDRFSEMGEMWAALEAARANPSGPHGASSTRDVGLSRGASHPPAASAGADTQAVSRSAPQATGERRICTVASIDLSAPAKLASRVEPEELEDLLERAQRLVVAEVSAMDGAVSRLGADRSVAVFGLSRASDNDPERAILAALRVQEAISRIPLPRAAGTARLAARIGIASGRIFASTDPDRQAPKLLGEAVSDAAELARAAPAGGVVSGRTTHRRVAGAFLVEPSRRPGMLPKRPIASSAWRRAGATSAPPSFTASPRA